ncbi:hypothetical protein BM1374166_01592 [Bartonella tribocorum]|nr:hypothetical protein BM1374166_01592 [Bartonella tribocorum]
MALMNALKCKGCRNTHELAHSVMVPAYFSTYHTFLNYLFSPDLQSLSTVFNLQKEVASLLLLHSHNF